ncbi:hypothetical protein N657DRAFT_122258 [Parathielavia appendiculata]|uniref:Uncharacterized protein n=1 Tax=Parathielavia appendiculata TaxID=2587402 RepID=A0AAN6TV80_9PEZI|nr:hypothetical protein N657DRAFT_122258 [Parathielavia appendiculata]
MVQGEIDSRNRRLQRCTQRRPWSGWEEMQPHAQDCRAAIVRPMSFFFSMAPACHCSRSNRSMCTSSSVEMVTRAVRCGLESFRLWRCGGCFDRGSPKWKLWRGFSSAMERDDAQSGMAPGGVPVFSGRQLMCCRSPGTNDVPGPPLVDDSDPLFGRAEPPWSRRRPLDRLLTCQNRFKGLHRTGDLPSHGLRRCSAVRTLPSGPVRMVADSLAKTSEDGECQLCRVSGLDSPPPTALCRILDQIIRAISLRMPNPIPQSRVRGKAVWAVHDVANCWGLPVSLSADMHIEYHHRTSVREGRSQLGKILPNIPPPHGR